MTPLDPRSVANVILRVGHQSRRPVTQLSLQKILYFVHGKHLIEERVPLVSGYFEAWQYGPVHPVVYSAFRSCGSSIIHTFATRRDLILGTNFKVDEPEDADTLLFIEDTVAPYLKLSAGRLVDLAHAAGSPWDEITRTKVSSERTYGQRITDDHIKRLFRHHKVSVGLSPRVGEPDEESPPTGN